MSLISADNFLSCGSLGNMPFNTASLSVSRYDLFDDYIYTSLLLSLLHLLW